MFLNFFYEKSFHISEMSLNHIPQTDGIKDFERRIKDGSKSFYSEMVLSIDMQNSCSIAWNACSQAVLICLVLH